MPFVFTMPSGISDELEQALSTIVVQLSTWGRRIDIPYQARYFSVESGTITPLEGGLNVFAYTVMGDYMVVSFSIQSLKVTGSPTYITITAPEGFRVKPGDRQHALVNKLYRSPIVIQTDVGSWEAGEVWVTNSASIGTIDNSGTQVSLHFHQLDDGAFSSSSLSIGLFGHCIFEYERVQ